MCGDPSSLAARPEDSPQNGRRRVDPATGELTIVNHRATALLPNSVTYRYAMATITLK